MGRRVSSWPWLAFVCWEDSGDPSLSPAWSDRSPLTQGDPPPQSCPLTHAAAPGGHLGFLKSWACPSSPRFFCLYFQGCFLMAHH